MTDINVENTEKNVEETERTFTQTEVDKIIGDRLAREREKYSDYDSLKAKVEELLGVDNKLKALQEEHEKTKKEYAEYTAATELEKLRAEVAGEKGVPVELLSGKTKEECEQQADIMLNHFKPSFSDGGEPQKRGGATPKDEFKKMFENYVR